MEPHGTRSAARHTSFTYSWRERERDLDRQMRDDLDDLVARASRGDTSAVVAVGAALGPQLLGHARELRDDEWDVQELVFDFLDVLANGCRRFRPGHAEALMWAEAVLRETARRQECEVCIGFEVGPGDEVEDFDEDEDADENDLDLDHERDVDLDHGCDDDSVFCR